MARNKDVLEGSDGSRIKTARLAKGLTQTEFAESLGIVQGFLSGIERGKKAPSDTLLIALCHHGLSSCKVQSTFDQSSSIRHSAFSIYRKRERSTVEIVDAGGYL